MPSYPCWVKRDGNRRFKPDYGTPGIMMDFYKSLPEETLAELIDGEIYISPSRTSNHQRILNKINVALYKHFETTRNGEVFIAPLDVYLDEEANAVQPDIVVVLNENKRIIDDKGHIHGSPDLIVEVLSPGNKDFDRIRKKDLYEKFGIKEYWIVDPENLLCAGFLSEQGRFRSIGEFEGTLNFLLLNLSVNL